MRRVLRAVTVMWGGRAARPSAARPAGSPWPGDGDFPEIPCYSSPGGGGLGGRPAPARRAAAVARRGVGGASPPEAGGAGEGEAPLRPRGACPRLPPASEGAANNNRPFGNPLVRSQGLRAEGWLRALEAELRPGEPRGGKERFLVDARKPFSFSSTGSKALNRRGESVLCEAVYVF